MALFKTKLVGKSRVAFWEKGGVFPQTKWVALRDIAANGTFALPQGVRLTGKVVVANRNASTQAAITVGTSAAGTQIGTTGTTATGVAQVYAGTLLAPTYSGGDRTIYVESSAWQSQVSVFLEAEEWPMTRDTDALS